jgi:hypothetical protein
MVPVGVVVAVGCGGLATTVHWLGEGADAGEEVCVGLTMLQLDTLEKADVRVHQ